MDNPWDEMRAAVRKARALEDAVASNANSLAELLQPHLHQVDAYYLRRFKRELRDFDMVTGRWKKR